jgi:hypothetical protein
MSQTILVPANQIEGNITTCKIENQIKSVERKSAFSLTETKNYMTYDVCNRQVISEYSIPEITGAIIFPIFIIPIILMFIIGILSTRY